MEVGDESCRGKCSVCVRVSPKGIPKQRVACLFIVLALASCSFVVNGFWEVMCLKRQLLSRVVFLRITVAARQAPLEVSVLEQMRAGRLPFLSQQFWFVAEIGEPQHKGV